MGSADVQGALWGGAPSDWAENESMCTPFYQALFDTIGVSAGVRLLDLGCGAGTAMALAAKAGATVSGVDASEGLLGYARQRLPQAEFRRGDLEELPYPDGSFDVVTAFNSVGFAADPVAALREAKRVTAPGGRFGMVVWGDPERCETRVILAAIGALLPPPPQSGTPSRSAEELMRAAGLEPGPTGEVDTPLRYPDLATAVRIQSSSGPARMAINHAGLVPTQDALAAAFAGARQPDGSYRHNNVFRYLVAHV
jgi:SAM-dependent methyltransferase